MSERGSKLLKCLDYYIGIPATVPIKMVRCLEKRNLDLTKIDSIAVMCLGAIGDLLLFSGLINGLRKKYPNARIDLFVSKDNFYAAQLIKNVDHVYSFPIKQVAKFINTLRANKYELLIDSSQWARIGAIISGLSKAKKTVGFKTKGQWRSLPYDQVVEHRNDCHEWQNYLNLGKSIFNDLDGFPEISVSDNVSEHIINYKKNKPFVVCHMWASGSNVELRQWGADNWSQLAHCFIDKGFNVFWSGSKVDFSSTELFLTQMFGAKEHYKQHIVNIAGEVNLEELSQLFQLADAVISVNTGIMHLAAVSGARTIGIHGPTNPIRWGPVGKRACSISPPNIKQFLNLGFEKIVDTASAASNVRVEDVLNLFMELDKNNDS